MERLIFALVVLLLLMCAVTTAVLRGTIDTVATAVVAEQAKTDPMDSLLAYSGVPERQTSPWVYVGGALLPLVLIGAAVIYMRFSTEWSKERRRANRRGGGVPPAFPIQQMPQLPAQPPRIPLPPPPARPGDRTW